MKSTNIFFCFLMVFIGISFYPHQVQAQLEGQVTIAHKGQEHVVTYELFLPDDHAQGSDNQPLWPVVVCVGGIPMNGDQYVRSSTKDCRSPVWEQFAKDHGFVILGLGFLFEPDDWDLKESFQFPRVWSGQALLNILDQLSQQYPINKNQLYMFGISGGAQFSTRLAFWQPDRVKAVAAHAAGSYDPALSFIPTRFLITVGEKDNEPFLRKAVAEEFAQVLALYNMDHQLKIVPDIAHRQTEEQNQWSRDFFIKTKDASMDDDHKAIEQSKHNFAISIPVGLHDEQLLQRFPRNTARTYRREADQEWITFLYGPKQDQLITFHFKNHVLINWGLNAREEVVDEYLIEFCSGNFPRAYPNIFKAIRDSLIKLPHDVFVKITDRRYPVIFLDMVTVGIARFANATEFVFRPDDPPAFEKGFYILKLGAELDKMEDTQAIEGIIYHELAHNVLDHLHRPWSCELEREANQLVKEWGFTKEFRKASSHFGAKSKSDSSCYGK